MPIVEGSLLVAIILIIIFVIAGVYVWNSVKSIVGQIVGAGFLIAALLIGLVVSGIL